MDLLNRQPSQEELREQQREEQDDRINLSANMREDIDPDYVAQMVDSELQPATADMISNLLSRDWMLSKMSDAEVHEARWLARTIMDEIVALHPPEDSIWRGDIREYASGDSGENLKPLSSQALTEVFQFIQGHIARVARSKDGFQQETFKKQIRKSERDNRDSNDSGGWF